MSSKSTSSSSRLLFVSLSVLLFIAGSTVGFILWKKSESAGELPSPAYVNLGSVVAQVGGGRFVRTNIQLEVRNDEATELVESEKMAVLQGVQLGLSSVATQDVYSVESKYQMQDAIQSYINHQFGQRLVKAVYFSDFLVSEG